MKEAIIVDLNGYMIDTFITSDNDTSVYPVYEEKHQEVFLEELLDPEDEIEEVEPVVIGYKVAIKINKPLHLPKFDIIAWNAYLIVIEQDRVNYENWINTPEEDRDENPPTRLAGNPSDFWIEGKVFDQVVELTHAKEAKIKQMNDECNVTILSGFESSALGESHTYDFDYEAQTNLGGMMSAILSEIVTESLSWKANGVPVFHTIDQFKQLFADGLIWKNTKIQEYWILKEQVNLAETIEDIESISWDI